MSYHSSRRTARMTLCVVLALACGGLILPAGLWAQDTSAAAPKELWQLDVIGNKALTTDQIKESIISTPSSRLKNALDFPGFGWGESKFDPVAFNSDLKRIEHLYQRMGYFKARVENSEVKPCSSAGRVCVRLTINEGEPTRIETVAATVKGGSPPRSSEEMAGVFGMKAGEIFEHGRYLTAKESVLTYLRERSYPLPTIEGEARYDEEKNTIGIHLTIKPGTAARIGLIRFEGLDEIRPDDALARLPIQTGMGYGPKVFDDAEGLLSDLEIFRSIDAELKPRAGQPEIVDVVYHVRERPLKTLQFGTGFRIENSRQEFRLRGEWINRNFYNHLRTFNVRLEPRYAVLPSLFRPDQSGPLGNAEVTMRQPAFLSPRQDLRTFIGFDSDLEQGYRWYGPRLGGNLERRLSRQFSVSGGYSFRYLTFYNVNLGAPNTSSTQLVPVELLFTDNYRLGFLDQRLTWDNRDNVVQPHLGTFAQLGLAESARFLGSGFTYLRTVPELRHYVPMTNRATLAMRALYGRIAPLEGRATPITERFYGGGANDHRGFTYHRLAPQVLTTDGRPVPVGGNLEVLFTAEERVRLFELGGHWVTGALFFDAGDVVEAAHDLDFTNLHYAIGPGLRYDSPVGVIRADVGFRLNRLSDRSDGRQNPDPGQRLAFHVSFGESF